MSGLVFVIADLHFGHQKVAALRGFANVFAHDNALVEAWNKVVDKRDVVYVLGDVFQLDRVAELHGAKKLALGNHDQKPMARYLELFTKVQAYFEFDGCLLSHMPVHPGQFPRYELHVHGHTHRNRLADPHYVPVSVEHCAGMAPVLLRPLVSAARRRLAENP